MKANKIPLLVTTEHRGVFFGYGVPTENKIIKLENARMCVYWSADVKGVLGLASDGPNKNCRVGPAVPNITLQAVTSVTQVSEAATKQWESNHWS